MGILDLFRKKKKAEETVPGTPVYMYDGPEIDALDEFICDMFGSYKNVFHELVSPDIHLDVCIVDPTEEDPYYKLVTMGAGAYAMDIPEKWRGYGLERAEYVIYLPKDWDLGSSAEEDYWPIRTLKNTARLPILCNTWLGYGHTVQSDEDGSPYASNTGFNSIVLKFGENRKGDVRLILPNGKTVNFYEIVPLYPEELAYKMENGADALFEKMDEKGIRYRIVDVHRENALK